MVEGCRILPGLQQGEILDSAAGLVDRGDVNFSDEADEWRFFWVIRSADYQQTVDSILEVGLARESITLYGPRMVPFQLERVISSPKWWRVYLRQVRS